MRWWYRVFFAAAVAVLALGSRDGAAQSQDAARVPVVMVADITGVIGPANELYLRRAAERAHRMGAEVLILRLDTPGGLVTTMREMVKAIIASPVPVIGYVAPSGAHAASAGTYILYATSIAAMAPGTNIGAASPVQFGGDGFPGFPIGDEKKKDEKPKTPASVIEAKSVNDLVALIRGLAQMRGRNAEWAEKAVREAATLEARQALKEGVIDLVAVDIDDLLKAVHGRKVLVGQSERTLSTLSARVERFEPTFIIKALGSLTNPNIALILMLLGVYGLIFELMSPGAIFPGVLGTICLLLGLYGLSELPLDHAGLALLLCGMVFMAAEAFVPSFGALGIGGAVAFVLGAAMLVNTEVPEFRVSYGVIAATAAVSVGFFMFVLGWLLRSQTRRVRSGSDELIGSPASVVSWNGPEGYVWAQGERWRARADSGFAPGDRVWITGLDGLTLIVSAKPETLA